LRAELKPAPIKENFNVLLLIFAAIILFFCCSLKSCDCPETIIEAMENLNLEMAFDEAK